MMTLRDRLLLQQWRQKAETTTLSLSEIAERWARLECGDDADEALVLDYLKVIAGEISSRQMMNWRLELLVTPSFQTRSYPRLKVINPWQPLHEMSEQLRAAAAGDKEAAATLRFTEQILLTVLKGAANQPPSGLFPRPVMPAAFLSTAAGRCDGEIKSVEATAAVCAQEGETPSDQDWRRKGADTTNESGSHGQSSGEDTRKVPVIELRRIRLRQWLTEKEIPECEWNPLRGWTLKEIYNELIKFDEFLTRDGLVRLEFTTFKREFWRKQAICKLPDKAK